MQTNFSLAQLADPDIARTDKILRNCVHCGFCTATCPTFVLLGDESDSPRGRIYYVKEMLEKGAQPTEEVVLHIDRCLSCLSCMTTCPSGVHYMHLIDHGRAYIERHYRRKLADRLLRRLLGAMMPRPWLLRLMLIGGSLARPIMRVLPQGRGTSLWRRLQAMVGQIPPRLASPSPVDRPQIFKAQGKRRKRVALLVGCGQRVLAPHINEASIRLLTRHGAEVVVAKGAGCCGSSVQHIGDTAQAVRLAKANIAAWEREIAHGGLDAIIANASGCGTTLKDYGHMLQDDPAWAGRAAAIAALARDISEVMLDLGLHKPEIPTGQRVAYHSACSMQHGQQIDAQPQALLRAAGFVVRQVPEGHLCCGWAGTYNILQPEISERLKARKVANIASQHPDIVAAGNFGCLGQIGSATATPVAHTVELLDWATGGPKPDALRTLP